MKNRGIDLMIFGSMLIVVAVLVNAHYSGLRKDIKQNFGV